VVKWVCAIVRLFASRAPKHQTHGILSGVAIVRRECVDQNVTKGG